MNTKRIINVVAAIAMMTSAPAFAGLGQASQDSSTSTSAFMDQLSMGTLNFIQSAERKTEKAVSRSENASQSASEKAGQLSNSASEKTVELLKGSKNVAISAFKKTEQGAVAVVTFLGNEAQSASRKAESASAYTSEKIESIATSTSNVVRASIDHTGRFISVAVTDSGKVVSTIKDATLDLLGNVSDKSVKAGKYLMGKAGNLISESGKAVAHVVESASQKTVTLLEEGSGSIKRLAIDGSEAIVSLSKSAAKDVEAGIRTTGNAVGTISQASKQGSIAILNLSGREINILSEGLSNALKSAKMDINAEMERGDSAGGDHWAERARRFSGARLAGRESQARLAVLMAVRSPFT